MQNSYINFWAILIFGTANMTVLGQEKFITFDEDIGYCSHSYHVIQDAHGFLWSATLTGLVKTDGYQYTKFTSDRADRNTIASNFSAYLFEDRYHNIWVNSFQYGLSIYDRSDDKFIRIKAGGSGSLQSDKISDIISVRDSIIYISGNAGLEKVILQAEDYSDLSFELFTFDNDKQVQNIGNSTIWDAEILNDSRLFISSVSGFALFDMDQERFIYPDEDPLIPDGVGFVSCLDTRRDNLWVAEANSPLIKINIKSGRQTYYEGVITKGGEHYMYIDSKDRLWIKENGFGIKVVDLATDSIRSYDTSPDSEINLKDRWAKRWMETTDGSLFLSSNSESRFQHIPSIERPIESTQILNDKNNNTSSIYEDDDFLLVSFYNNGVFFKDKNTNQAAHFTRKNSPIQDDLILHVERLQSGQFLILGKPHAYLMDPLTREMNIISSSFFYRNGIELSNGDLWLFSEAYSVDRIRKNANGQYEKEILDVELSKYTNYREAIENEDGTIWIISAAVGLILTNIDGDILKTYTLNNNQSGSIISQSSECLYKDSKGRIWVGSLEGLSFLDPNTDTFTNFSIEEGLDDTSISDVVEDDKGQIWVSSFDGLYKYEEDKQQLSRVSQSQLLNSNFGQRGFFNFQDKIYAAGTKGIDIIRSVEKSINNVPPIIQLTNIYREDDRYDQRTNLEVQSSLTFSPAEKDVSLEFSALHYGTAASKIYQYRHSDPHEKWIDFTSNRKIPMSRFAYGTHTIEVRASNADGVWCKPKPYKITLQAPWHKTYWFYVLALLGICGLFYASIKWKLYQMERTRQQQLETERHITDLEMKALKAQMNPHFIFNALNSIKGLIINGSDKEAAVYISKFSKLVRRVLDNSASRSIHLKEELEVLEIYIKLEQLRFRDKFTYTIDIADDIPQEMILIPPVTLQPFVENAIWHGFKNSPRKNHISIVGIQKEGEITLTIEDNGSGRRQSKTATNNKSHGITITRKRILNFGNDHDASRLIYKDKYDENGTAMGTLVFIRLPIKYQDND